MAETQVPFFSAVKVEAFTWKVRVPVPAEGKFVFAEFDARFRYMNDDAWRSLQAENLPQRELAKRVLVGIVLLQGENAPNLRTEPELIDQVIDVDRAAAAIVGTYAAVLLGLAPEGN